VKHDGPVVCITINPLYVKLVNGSMPSVKLAV
jgi:hypothetical protein